MASIFTGRTDTRIFAAIAAGAVIAASIGAYLLWPRHIERTSCVRAETATDQIPGMVWVPGGTYEAGGDVYPEERPRRIVTVDGFWMDRTEVTNAQFGAFVSATGYVTVAERPVDRLTHPDATAEFAEPGAVVFVPPASDASLRSISSWWRYKPGANWRHPGGPGTSLKGRDDFPVTALAYKDVLAYAKWAGKALPSEVQWEWAARAGTRDPQDPRLPPTEANTWQGVFPVIDTSDDGFAGVAPVGCYAANALGLHDMIGNLWEWTTDVYVSTSDARPSNRKRVIKGGSFLCAPNYCLRYRPEARQGQEEDLATSHLGFRTILIAPGPPNKQ